MSDIEARVKKIIAEQLGVLEADFSNEIPDEEAEKITTVQLAIDYAKAHAKA